MIASDKVILLADAEFGEDAFEDVVGGDVAGDFAEMANDAADVLANQVAREVHSKRSLSISQGLICQGESLVVAHIRDYNTAAI